MPEVDAERVAEMQKTIDRLRHDIEIYVELYDELLNRYVELNAAHNALRCSQK